MQTAEVVAFAKSIKFLKDLGIKNIENHESEVLEYGIEQLRKNNSVKIIGIQKKSFYYFFHNERYSSHDIATILDDDGVALEQGTIVVKYCMKTGIPASAEPSIGLYTTKRILIYCVMQLTNVKKYLRVKWI